MTSLTKPNEIINKTYTFIEDSKDVIVALNETSIEFIELYDRYNDKFIYDASLLKEKMKTAVLKAVSDDI